MVAAAIVSQLDGFKKNSSSAALQLNPVWQHTCQAASLRRVVLLFPPSLQVGIIKKKDILEHIQIFHRRDLERSGAGGKPLRRDMMRRQLQRHSCTV